MGTILLGHRQNLHIIQIHLVHTQQIHKFAYQGEGGVTEI